MDNFARIPYSVYQSQTPRKKFGTKSRKKEMVPEIFDSINSAVNEKKLKRVLKSTLLI